ncbi:MAG: hypothetical protein ACI90V_013165, partial [Bacillariaceae sp.]
WNTKGMPNPFNLPISILLRNRSISSCLVKLESFERIQNHHNPGWWAGNKKSTIDLADTVLIWKRIL